MKKMLDKVMKKKKLFIISFFYLFFFIPFLLAYDFPETYPQESISMPESACQFYYGYYTMSTDMGSLILKVVLIFAGFELFHKLITYLVEYGIQKFKNKKNKINEK